MNNKTIRDIKFQGKQAMGEWGITFKTKSIQACSIFLETSCNHNIGEDATPRKVNISSMIIDIEDIDDLITMLQMTKTMSESFIDGRVFTENL